MTCDYAYNGDIQKRLKEWLNSDTEISHHTTTCYWDTRLLFVLHERTSITTKTSSHLLHLPRTGSYPLTPAQNQGAIILQGTKNSLPPLQHTCSCQPYRRQLTMSTQPQQQTGVTLSPRHRQENTAPQDQTPAHANRTPLPWTDSARTLHCHRQTGKDMLYTWFFTICTHANQLCVNEISSPYLH